MTAIPLRTAERPQYRRRTRPARAPGAWPPETVLRGRAQRYLLLAGSLGFAALVAALGSFAG